MRNNQLLKDCIKELQSNGFKIYTSSPIDEMTYFYFVKDDQIGYCQVEYFGGLSFSSVHIGNIQSGTGFSVANEVYKNFVRVAQTTLNTFKPYWARQRETPQKYKSWDHYLSFPLNQTLTYIEVKL